MAVDLNDIEKMEIKNVNSGKVSLFTNKIFRVSLRKANRDLGYIIPVSRTPKSPNPTSINL